MGTLPQELNDDIFERVFTANPETYFVHEQYKTPAVLQVNRATRKKFSKSYYDSEGIVFLQTEPPFFPLINGRDLSSYIAESVQYIRNCAYVRGPRPMILLHTKCRSQDCAVLMEIIHAKLGGSGLKGMLMLEKARADAKDIAFYPKKEKSGEDLTTVGQFGPVMLRVVIDE